MTYRETEDSRYDSAPIELFEFVGTFRTYRMTSASTEYTYNEERYTPIAGLDRSEVDLAIHSEDQAELEIAIPSSTSIVKDHALQDTPPDLDFTLYRVQRDTGDAVIYFRGSVTQIKIDGDKAKLLVPSRFREVLANTIPTVFVQAPCNHVLFDQRCKVSRAANSHNTEIVSVSDRTIEVDSTGAFGADFFVGGELIITATGERRTIVSQTGSIMEINFEFNKVTSGDAISIAAGCDHGYTSTGGCPKFANQLNFGGCPFVPGQSNNVFSTGIS
jgi:uncharacterized phage protein (TIGR02218 family)